MAELSDSQIADLIRSHIKKALDADEHQRNVSTEPITQPFYGNHTQVLQLTKEVTQSHLGSNNIKWISESVDQLLNEEGVALDPTSTDYRKLCREYMKAEVYIWDVIKKRHQGDYTKDPAWSPVKLAQEPPQEDPPPALAVSELMQKYLKQGEREGSWTEKTHHEVETDLKLFIRIMGDIPVNTINHAVANSFKDTLLQLPPRINKAAQYRDKSIAEILEMKPKEKRSIRTINKSIIRMGALFKYGIRHGYMEMNPMEGLTLREVQSKKEKRLPFETTDLQRIFNCPDYTDDTWRTDYNFWMPILGLYTGARIGELAQLHLSDFILKDDLWCIDIKVGADDQRVKTDAGVRVVPLHPFLVDDLRLIQKVDAMKTQGLKRLFPDINRTRDGYGQTVSKWFGYHKQKWGIKDPRKVFHSFRHTVISKLAHAGVNDHVIKSIVGHAEDTTTYDTYVKLYPVKKMHDAIKEHLTYDIDLSHLKASKYCG